MFCYVIRGPVRHGLGLLSTSLEKFLLGFMIKGEMVMKILALQEFYESLLYFGFIIFNATFNQLTRLKQYLAYIDPLGYYYCFSEKCTNFYDTTDNLLLDNILPVSPYHAGQIFPDMFMMYVCVYNHLLSIITQNVPWKATALDLLDAIMRQLVYIYVFVMAATWKALKLCPPGIIQFRRFCIYAIRQPHKCLG